MAEKVSINPADVMSAQDLAAQYRGRATNSRNTDTRSGLVSGVDPASLVQTGTGFSGRVVGNGRVEDMKGAVGTASLAVDGMVELPNGMTVSREVAIRAGFVKETANGLVLADMDFADDRTKQQVTRQQSQQQQDMDDEARETARINETFAAADAALDAADKSFPQDVKVALTNAAIEGDLGVVEQMVGEQSFNAMVAGYTAFINNLAKSETGIGDMSELMTYVLDEGELAMARRAALFKDTQSLKYLAASTFKALNDPAKNGALIAEIREAGIQTIRKDDGTFSVVVDGIETSIQDAFKRGLLRFD